MRGRRWQARSAGFLDATAAVKVRFHEVDAMRVVWHGHYLAYFEEARVEFGNRYGLDYGTILKEGYVAPIIRVEVEHLRPVHFGETLSVRARLHPEAGARIVFSYSARNAKDEEVANGLSWQAFTDLNGELSLTRPAFFDRWLARWEAEFRTA